jgi:hypothetical protein
MTLATKLNVTKEMKVRVVAKPASVDLSDLATTPAASAQGIIASFSGATC